MKKPKKEPESSQGKDFIVGDSTASDGKDFIITGPSTSDGGISIIRHDKNHNITSGVIHPVKDGKPLSGGELLNLHKTENENIFEVQPVELDGKIESVVSHSGPAMVNSRAYQNGWDNIFGKKPVVGKA